MRRKKPPDGRKAMATLESVSRASLNWNGQRRKFGHGENGSRWPLWQSMRLHSRWLSSQARLKALFTARMRSRSPSRSEADRIESAIWNAGSPPNLCGM
uniref:Uncharacterized protein n=1 Tax=Arundo donax TaxID=35708 RepID=A0A0A9DKJ6_ARUDO